MGNAASAVKQETVTMKADRETKNTWRFTEVGDPDDHKIGTLYVPKDTLDAIGASDTINVTVEAA